MDAARCAKRLGAENVYIVYRRGMAELPARKEEVEHAEEEGIVFKTLTNPTEVLGDENGWVKGITCVEMELGEPDASGHRRPIVKEGSEFVLDVDTMIMALGTSPNLAIRKKYSYRRKRPLPFMPRRSLYKSLSVRRTARQIYPLTAF